MKYLELLAPARNKEIGIAAISCGADAIYIAGPAFGARQSASNSIEDIKELCDYAHKFGARVFITLNTILYDDELERAQQILKEIEKAGADAIIAQDLALLDFKTTIPLHASTQCAIRDSKKALFYKNLGFSRIVLEREMSLEEIHEIKQKTGCEIEFFVHGALCVCYSGNCYLSEKIDNRSANRGACMQACRSLYDLVDKDNNVLIRNKALLSLKDYNLKNRLSDLIAVGVDSFKIEGRLKNVSYVKNVVRDYSIALDTLIEKHNQAIRRTDEELWARASFGSVECGFTPNTKKTFNRGYTELFLDGQKGKWSSMNTPSNIGEYIGSIQSIKNSGRKNICIKVSNNNLSLNNGDGFTFIDKNNQLKGFRGDICSNNEIICKDIPGLHRGTKLYRNLDIEFEKTLDSGKCERNLNVDIFIDFLPDFKLRYIAKSEDGRIVEDTIIAGEDEAKNEERIYSMLENQLSKKSDDYIFHVKDISKSNTASSKGDLEENIDLNKKIKVPFMKAAFMNSIRRDIAEKLNLTLCKIIKIQKGEKNKENALKYAPQLIDYKGNVANSNAKRIYKDYGVENVESAYELGHKNQIELMRTKYCIRYELNMCPKYHDSKIKNPLFLLNNGQRFELEFDCKNCEMIVK